MATFRVLTRLLSGVLTGIAMTACGGSGSSGPPLYSVGGTVIGVSGTDGAISNAVVLQNNLANDLSAANGAFTFTSLLVSGASYDVSVKTPPVGQTCVVGGGTGTIADRAVTDVTVTCIATAYHVGGSVSGLHGTIGLQLNAAETLSVSADGGFSFTTTLADGDSYGVTISAQPAGQTCVVANGAGTIAADVTDVSVSCTTSGTTGAAGNVTTLAGSGSPGHSDGTGSAASFNAPGCLAVDSAGNTYVPDTGNHLVRKVTPGGVVTTIAGSGTAGHADGVGAAASFNAPAAVALDASGNLYVAENTLIRKIASDGTVTTLAGSIYGVADGPAASAEFEIPAGIAVDQTSGDVYVADRDANNIRKITASGQVTTLAGTGQIGFTDGPGAAATFNAPRCLALDAAGNLFVADTYNHLIRKIDGAGTVTTAAGSGGFGAANGPAGTATFANPYAVALDPVGNVYIADFDNDAVRKLSASGEVTTFAGVGTPGAADGPAATATFWLPDGIAYDSLHHRLVLADQFTSLIRTIEIQ